MLFWTPQHQNKPYKTKWPQGQSVFIKQKCQYINCYITYDKHFLSEDHRYLDAVIFNARDVITYPELNLTRSQNQIYIFHSMDSSENFPICNSFYDNFFNYTWTYKLNSDIPDPLLNIFDANNTLVGPKRNMNWIINMTHNERVLRKVKEKKNAVAWMSTKCKTKVKYEDFLREFAKELKGYNHTLDIFGACGNKKCPESRKTNCYTTIERNYFFILILEDSYAEDYVTAKLVKAMTHVTIPIILGSSNYNSFLPPGSYINAQSYDMKKMGAIIDYLIRYPTTYSYFFDWKNHYYYTVRPRLRFCDVCEKLNRANGTNVYTEFRKWWNPDFRDTCQQLKYRNTFT
ncbi:alpha-(1,3)-fucosyltransferase C-like [Danaus plexippus]|nr:alpha-(1,3)-fucosyltransferase C-like [Danaus plexippus]